MLPQFGFAELLFVAIVALIVVGPKDLPMMMRKLGQFVSKGRAMANEFRAAFDDIARQAELDELRNEIESLKRENAVSEAVDDLRDIEQDINKEVLKNEAAAKAAASDRAQPTQSSATATPKPEANAPTPDPESTEKS